MNRGLEVRQLNKLSVQEIKAKAGEHLLVLKNPDNIYHFLANDIVSLIEKNNSENKVTAGIFPFGPTGQYSYFIDIVNKKKISLLNTYFFFMDEYADINGVEIPSDHHLSFRGQLNKMFKKISKNLLPDYTKIIFPLSENIYNLSKMIGEVNLGATYGGVGIHGHIAFNEPEKGVRNTDPRVVQLDNFTVTINAIRDKVGGNLENFPRKALTLGMNQLFSAEKMIFSCRNGIENVDWANTVLRLALLGEPGDDYPVTYLKEHKNWIIVTDEETIRTPNSI